MNIHDITKQFEQAICDYTGSPYCVCVDNESNALFMALIYEGIEGKEITIPSNTYPSVPCEIINAGGKVKFDNHHESLRALTDEEKRHFIKVYDNLNIYSLRMLQGEYQLKPSKVWDSALRFTADMYRTGQFQCLSFTGPWKRLKAVKGGAILTDNHDAYEWFKRFRFSGRHECSYFEDTFDFIGKNYYLPHILASIGLHQLLGFYNQDGTRKHMEDIELPYPDLSQHPIYKT